MHLKKGIVAGALALALAALVVLSGCASMTVEDILAKAISANDSIENMESDIATDFILTMGEEETSMSMSGTAITHMEPLKMKMVMDMSVPGLDTPVKTEIYGVEEDGGFATYTYAEIPGMEGADGAGSWLKQTTPLGDLGQLKQADGKASMELYLKSADNFIIDGEEDINGVKCTKLSGVLTGDAMKEAMMSSSAADTLSQIGADANVLEGLGDLPMTIWVDSKTFMPQKCAMDMGALMDGMMKSLGGEAGGIGVKKCTMEMTYRNINSAADVVLPAEAANAIELPPM